MTAFIMQDKADSDDTTVNASTKVCVYSYMYISYIRNCSRKKMDFTNLGAFTTIFLYHFLLITKPFN